jgi:hypothetical protein
MGKLTDILATGGGGSNIGDLWNATTAADDYRPIPAGEYVARIVSGELETSRQGTPGFKLTYEICEGEFTGRRLWLDLWLTEAALPMTKRDLAKIGISRPEQLEQPMPPGIVCKLKIALRKDDDGTERNRVSRFELLRVEQPTVNPFAPGEPT